MDGYLAVNKEDLMNHKEDREMLRNTTVALVEVKEEVSPP